MGTARRIAARARAFQPDVLANHIDNVQLALQLFSKVHREMRETGESVLRLAAYATELKPGIMDGALREAHRASVSIVRSQVWP